MINQINSNLSMCDTASKTVTTVALISVQIVASNPNRRGMVLYNNSTNSCYVTPESPAIASNCMEFLATNAGPTSLSKWLGPLVYTGALYGIRNAGTGTVTVWELT